jgi:methyl-accepting chemotaxis protein
MIFTVVVAVVTAVAGFLAGLAVSRRGRPDRLTDVLERAAAGDLAVRATDVHAGRAGASLNRLLDQFGEFVRLSGASNARLTALTERLAGLVRDTAAGAQASVQASAEILRSAQDVSEQLGDLAQAANEMGGSIHEISRSVSDAVSVAADARDVSADASRIMTKLGDSSAQIGDVVKVITAIAGQTNLLALNATIEAARAGEMGKGFAVVASEVKDLAQETAKATNSITTQVDTIQGDTSGVVGSITQIGEVIGRVNDHQSTIVATVERQRTTAGRMTRSIEMAGAQADQIAEMMAKIAQKRILAKATAEETGEVAGELASANEEYAAAMQRFRP